MNTNWKHVSRLSPCPVCGKPDWCSVSPDRCLANCYRIEEGSVKRLNGGGWLHGLKPKGEGAKFYVPKPKPLPEHNEVLAEIVRGVIRSTDRVHLVELATKLGVSIESVFNYNIGYDVSKKEWVFPMLRRRSELVGVRTRSRKNYKGSYKGSKAGMFVPNDFKEDGVVYICEGESDTLALHTCTLNAIGRPSCLGGEKIIKELVEDRDVVVCLDYDEAGRKGAEKLAEYLKCHCKSVKMFEPPDGINDMREWVNKRGTKEVYVASERLHKQKQEC